MQNLSIPNRKMPIYRPREPEFAGPEGISKPPFMFLHFDGFHDHFNLPIGLFWTFESIGGPIRPQKYI